MALLTIHIFVEDEVITADDLNSIGEAVSAAISSGNIASSSLVWPFVAQGEIDMNGYGISNISSFFNQYHVNDNYTIQEAIAAVNAAGGGTIIIDPGASPVVSDDLITASNVSILGTSGKSLITVSGSATLYGIGFTGNYPRVEGVQITGGATGIPCLDFSSCEGGIVESNTFSACVGPCIEFPGTGGAAKDMRVTNNSFGYCSEEAIITTSLTHSCISGNTFESVDGNNIQLADNTGACNNLTISDNVFRNGDAACIQSPRTASASSDFGQLAITGNVLDPAGSYESIDIGTYINCSITGNTVQNPSTISVQRSTVTGNAFNSTLEINTSSTVFSSNSFRGAVSRVSGANNWFTGNVFEAAVEIDAAWVDSFVANTCTAGVTVTATDPDVVGLNWGF